MSIENIISRLEDVKSTSNGWQAKCPVHDDRKASLCIHQEPDGKVLMTCQAGCDTEAVLRALGLDWSALFPGGVEHPPDVATRPKPAKRHKGPRARAIKETYSYTDENGNELYRVVRWEPKDFTVQHFEKTDKVAGYVDGLGGRPRVLYRLPRVKQDIAEGRPIFLVEGEKDVHTVEGLGHTGTCNAGGAGKWLDSYTRSLAGADVILVPDADLPGRKHAELIGMALRGTAARIRFIRLPVKQAKGDISDWVACGGTAEEFAKLIGSAQDWEPGALVSADEETPLGPDGEPLNDLGNARRLVKRHGDTVRFCHDAGKWYCWDGRRWVKDETGEIVRKAKVIVDEMLRQAAVMRRSAESDADDSELELAKAFERHAVSSGNHRRILAMISQAESEPGITILANGLDADPWVFNCGNGTIDLRTGDLRPHCRDDLISKTSEITYNPNAQCPTWERFISEVFQGDDDLVRFVHSAAGYTLTGDTREQVFFILHGCGSNGKSTFIGVLRDIFGDYETKTSTDTLVEKNNTSNTNDVAALRGARFVSAIETSAGKRLAEALVKELTGQDAVTARFLYQEFFTFLPVFKLWLACNHVPIIQGQDHGIWRRIRLVPFGVQFQDADHDTGPYKDKDLPEKLKSEYEGILAWLVRGCLDWQKDGLPTAKAVRAATGKLQQDMDVLGGFLGECCVFARNAQVTAKDLYTAYCKWAEANGEKPLSQRWFGLRLAERGTCTNFKGARGTRCWQGIGLLCSDHTPFQVADVADVALSPRESSVCARDSENEEIVKPIGVNGEVTPQTPQAPHRPEAVTLADGTEFRAPENDGLDWSGGEAL